MSEPDVKVKRYFNGRMFEKDARKMARDRWVPTSQTSNNGALDVSYQRDWDSHPRAAEPDVWLHAWHGLNL